MTKDEQARARLVEIALATARFFSEARDLDHLMYRDNTRRRAGFPNVTKGSWCAAGLTAAMEDAGLVVPAPGMPARRGAVALLDWVAGQGQLVVMPGLRGDLVSIRLAKPGDIIAWLQNKAPEEWLPVFGKVHAFATTSSQLSMCGQATYPTAAHITGARCSSCVWETRKGHVALIVAVDSESISTVGCNEGNAPGRVMKRRLWRQQPGRCANARYQGHNRHGCPDECWICKGTGMVQRSSTVLYRRPGGLYGIARPVAR